MKSVTKSDNGKLGLSEQDKLRECEQVIKAGHRTFIEVGNALAAIRDERLYREKFKSFDSYCQDRWGFTKSRANQLIGSGKVATIVATSETPIANEAQARALAPLSEDAQLEAWEEAVETAPNGKVTAKHVEQVVAKKLGKDETPAPVSQEQPETAPETQAATLDPDSLEAACANLDKVAAAVRNAANIARLVFAVKGQDINAPWLNRFSWTGAVGILNQYLRMLDDLRPVGGTKDKPITNRDAKAEKALSK